jgi:hypothetical protein
MQENMGQTNGDFKFRILTDKLQPGNTKTLSIVHRYPSNKSEISFLTLRVDKAFTNICFPYILDRILSSLISLGYVTWHEQLKRCRYIIYRTPNTTTKKHHLRETSDWEYLLTFWKPSRCFTYHKNFEIKHIACKYD